MNFKEKIKSYSFWTTLSAAVVLLVESLGRAFGFSVAPEIVSDVIMAICGVLIVLGIVVKPTQKSEHEEEDESKKKGDNQNDKKDDIL